MAYFIVETCIGCTACTNRCPTEAITGARKLLHVIDPVLCVDCGACGVVCPAEAIYDDRGALTAMLKKPQRPLAFVDELACTGCDKCAEHCPFDCLQLEPGVDPDPTHFGVMRVEEPKCTGCRECEKACPYDAIFVFRRDQVPAWLRANVGAIPRRAGGGPAAPAPAAAAPERST
ncbi:MAG TPA: 4Fe-4S binding protein [Anaeromyxobacter sp.]|nr:4Fe-4S binding protein [Anaeromyxobacter sp.]